MDEKRSPKVKDRVRAVQDRLIAIRSDLSDLGIMDALDRIEERYAVSLAVRSRVRETDVALHEVEAVKLLASKVWALSERAAGALADNSGDLDMTAWLAQARAVQAIAERAEDVLSAKRRKAEAPAIRLWLIGEELPKLYNDVYGEEFPRGSRTGPGVRFVNNCWEYVELSRIERDLLALRWNDDAPAELSADPAPIPGETIKTLAGKKV